MARGFSVSELIDRPPDEVWAYLTDFANASKWMTGVDGFRLAEGESLEAGARIWFTSRGAERGSVISALDPGRRIALTSTQGGVTATYVYAVAPEGDGTRMTLDAACEATGLWKLLHPVITWAMKRSDSSHLRNINAAMSTGA